MSHIDAKIFLDKKQEEHFNEFGVFADTNSKIAEWMEEYHMEGLNKIIEKNLTTI